MKRVVWLLVVLLVAGAAFIATDKPSRNILFGPDWPARCDEYAADPDDQDSEAKGVAAEEIRSDRAVEACLAAVNLYPEDHVLRYQYARALDAAEYFDEAAQTYSQASEMGSCAATAHLADYYSYGHASDAAGTSEETAMQLYGEAAPCYAPAAKTLEMLTFRVDGLAEPKAAQALYEGRVDELNTLRPLVASYIIGARDAAGMDFHPIGSPCLQWARPDLKRKLESAELGDPSTFWERIGIDLATRAVQMSGSVVDPIRKGDIESYRADLRDIGRKDMILLFNRHGCEGPVIEHIFGSVQAFADKPKSLLAVVQDVKARHDSGVEVDILQTPGAWVTDIAQGAQWVLKLLKGG